MLNKPEKNRAPMNSPAGQSKRIQLLSLLSVILKSRFGLFRHNTLYFHTAFNRKHPPPGWSSFCWLLKEQPESKCILPVEWLTVVPQNIILFY